MNKSLQYHTAVNRHDDFDHSVLAELIARRWKQDRSYFTLHETSRGAQLEASWRRQPGRSALELHWSHPRHPQCACRPCFHRRGQRSMVSDEPFTSPQTLEYQ